MKHVFKKIKALLVFGVRFKLRPHEEAVLDAWQSCLSPDAKDLLAGQLKQLECYQDQAGGKLLGFFCLDRRLYPCVSEERLFPCRLGPCVVARVHLSGSNRNGVKKQVRAEVHLHKGQLISLQFNQPPADRLVRNLEVTRVEVLRDPMIPTAEATIPDAVRRQEALSTIRSGLPDEYLQIIGQDKGASINEWSVFWIPDIRKIPQRDGNYYVLAEKEGMGAVGVKEDDMSGQPYYLDHGSDSGERIKVGLRKFLQEFDGGKVEGRF